MNIQDIQIHVNDINGTYKVIGTIKARVQALTVFSKSPTIEAVNLKLQTQASSLGANAVINVQYNRGVSLTSWKALTATGTAVFIDQAPAQAHAPPPMAPQSTPPVANAQGWHAMINGQQQGPYPLNQLVIYIQNGQVNHQTMVWKAGMAGWVSAAQAPELAGYLPPTPPPPPPTA